MKKAAIAAFVILLMAVPVLTTAAAAAIPPTAEDLASDCNDDGLVDIAVNTRYHGGTGELTQDCRVTMAGDTKLVLDGVVMTSTCCFLVISPAGANTNVVVSHTQFDLASTLQLTTGCCSGDPGGENARVTVNGSDLAAETIELGASVGNPDGKVRVQNSKLRATGTSPVAVLIHASYGDAAAAVHGSTIVAGSELHSAGGIRIDTGAGGDTRARANTLDASTVVITTGPDGSCRSAGNIPDVVCS